MGTPATRQPRTRSVSVRDLVEFVWRSGNLRVSSDFSPPDRALQGIEGHKRIQSSRPEGYIKEYSVRDEITTPQVRLILRGRIDGYWLTDNTLHLEEIKTRLKPRPPSPDQQTLHWGQLKIYAFLLLRELNRSPTDTPSTAQTPPTQVRLQLTYLILATDAIEETHAAIDPLDLASFYRQTLDAYLDWLKIQNELDEQRDSSILASSFPFPRFRPGQRDLAKVVYNAAKKGAWAFVEAPTGIGKTLSTLFPALKAMGEGRVRRILYLTAKTSGRALVENALLELARAGFKLRSITLTSRSRACRIHSEPCESQSCPLAQNYYSRRSPTLRQLTRLPILSRESLHDHGQSNTLCPYALAHDLAPWADVVIGDFNHLFDPRSRLGFLDEDPAGTFVLIDEAHNLPDRAREMFSSTLSPVALESLQRDLKSIAPEVAKSAAALARGLRKLLRDSAPNQTSGPSPLLNTPSPPPPPEELSLFPSAPPQTKPARSNQPLTPPQAATISSNLTPTPYGSDRWTIPEAPNFLTDRLESFLSFSSAWLASNASEDPSTRKFVETYFEVGAWLNTLRSFDSHCAVLLTSSPQPNITLLRVDPASRLREILEVLGGATFFSATLSPLGFFRNLLGGTSSDPQLRLPSPFPPSNLRVLVQDRIPTHYRARTDSILQVVDAIRAFAEAHPGNYIAFFPSHLYLSATLEQFQTHAPNVEVFAQSSGMSEEQKIAFINHFTPNPTRTRLGFALLGGIFGEGIDLIGDRLSGAIIVGVGLPQISFERDVIRNHFQRSQGAGFEFAYVYPGINRVIQAAGRVIRSEVDRGALLLIDPRFVQPRFRDLLPPSWNLIPVRSPEEITSELHRFWETPAPPSTPSPLPISPQEP